MENTKIKDICSRYPWTEEAEAELAEFRKKAVPMFTAEVAAATEANYDKYGLPSKEELDNQHEKMMAEAAIIKEKFDKEFRENPIKVLEDQINYYIDFINAFMDPKATDEQKEKVWPNYKDYSSEFIRERALKNRRYLEKELPALLEKFLAKFPAKQAEKGVNPKKQAEREGAITELGFYSATITDKYYRYALTPLENNAAYIQQLDEDFIQQLEFNPENGVMSFKSKRHEPIKIRNAVTNRSIKNLDLQLLRSLYTIIYNNATNISTDTVTVYLPTLTEHLGIRINNSKPNDLFKKIRAFENTVGVLSGGAIYKLLDFLKYEPDGNLITFASPYMNTILRQLEKRNTKTAKKGGDRYINPHHSFLVHSNMANERNKTAIEVVQIIVTLLQQRGEIKNNITTASIKFSTIIDQIPELREKLIGDTTAGNKNNYLRRTFKKAYELLRSKTDLYQYYNNLSIPEIIPSTTTIDQVITISHNGKNQNYKQP